MKLGIPEQTFDDKLWILEFIALTPMLLFGATEKIIKKRERNN